MQWRLCNEIYRVELTDWKPKIDGLINCMSHALWLDRKLMYVDVSMSDSQVANTDPQKQYNIIREKQ